MTPRVTVVIEGYNESRELGTAVDTLAGLARQTFPLGEVEVVLLGSREQAEAWREALAARPLPFADVRTCVVDGGGYYAQKNRSAAEARAAIVALTDSDVVPRPEWLAAIVDAVEGGADMTAGLSFFKNRDSWDFDSPVRLVASSITWGWNVGKGRSPGPVGFMDHNIGFRTEILRGQPYPEELGRTRAAPLVLHELRAAGRDLRLSPHQKAVHSFSWGYWLRLHFRYGYEVYEMRRMVPGYPARWMRRAGPLEPWVTMGWHMLLDVPRWFRVSRLVPLSPVRRVALLPLLLALSVVARGAEAAGLFRTRWAHAAMAEWANSI
jgi:glycosyltransferase involved in cell wall biosynthesis